MKKQNKISIFVYLFMYPSIHLYTWQVRAWAAEAGGERPGALRLQPPRPLQHSAPGAVRDR